MNKPNLRRLLVLPQSLKLTPAGNGLPCEYDSFSGLQYVLFEHCSHLLCSFMLFQLNGLMNGLHFVQNVLVIVRKIKDSTEDFLSFFFTTTFVQPTRRFRDANDNEDNSNTEHQLDSDRGSPCRVAIDVAKSVINLQDDQHVSGVCSGTETNPVGSDNADT